MKQPELGRKITELRKGKGFTQEELVDRCNISVRTLQRIEAGEVTPRVYTIKTILAALDYDISSISENENSVMERITCFFRDLFLIGIDPRRPADYLVRQLNKAWIMGLLYFVIGFFQAAAEYFRMEESRLIYSDTLYVIIKVVVFITFFFFQRGFIVAGYLFRNYLLKIVSYILIFGTLLVVTYDIASLFYDAVERQFILGAEAVTFGGIWIIYGVALMRLKNRVGLVANFAGVFEIVAGCFYITVVLFFIGAIIRIPAELFEIAILYKSAELIREKQQKTE